ncbi:hypothetical protein HDE_00686 [Halotydeus destructor]|nr:hypothetical protein HDE_00686 [Halotydeus destructor]
MTAPEEMSKAYRVIRMATIVVTCFFIISTPLTLIMFTFNIGHFRETFWKQDKPLYNLFSLIAAFPVCAIGYLGSLNHNSKYLLIFSAILSAICLVLYFLFSGIYIFGLCFASLGFYLAFSSRKVETGYPGLRVL